MLNPNNIRICLEYLKEDDPDYPVIVDAGVGTASDVTIAMELGVDGVLLNTGIAHAKDPLRMADAMRHATEAGRLAYLSGRIPKRLYATASSPEEGVITREAAIVSSSTLLPVDVYICYVDDMTHYRRRHSWPGGPHRGAACRITSSGRSSWRWPTPSRGRSPRSGIWWPKRAPASARASPTSCRRFWRRPSAKPKREADDGNGDEPPPAPKIVISTHTISLQEQLIGKDLPLLNA